MDALKDDIITNINLSKSSVSPAAMQRKIDLALEKLEDFNSEDIVKDIKTEIGSRFTQLTDKYDNLINSTVAEAKTALSDTKRVFSKIEHIQQNHATKLRDINNAVGARVDTDTKLIDAMDALTNQQKDLAVRINENSAQITSLRQDFKGFVTEQTTTFSGMFAELRIQMAALMSGNAALGANIFTPEGAMVQ